MRNVFAGLAGIAVDDPAKTPSGPEFRALPVLRREVGKPIEENRDLVPAKRFERAEPANLAFGEVFEQHSGQHGVERDFAQPLKLLEDSPGELRIELLILRNVRLHRGNAKRFGGRYNVFAR